jgi:hypothetical protein
MDANTYHVTLKAETMDELDDLYPGALDATEAIRMAVDEAMHRRRSD